MDIVLLILAAVAIPVTILAFFLFFSRSMVWLAPRPRTRASIFAVLGILYPVIAVWEASSEGWRPSSYLQITMGVFWIVGAIAEYKRGVVSFE